MSKPPTSGLTPFEPQPPLAESPGLKAQEPWECWEEAALAAGVPDVLAALGRGVMCQAHERGWDLELLSECGWSSGRLWTGS